MRLPLFFITIAAASALHATSLTYTSCTLGPTTQTNTGPASSSCSIPVIVSNAQVGEVAADASAFNTISAAANQASLNVTTDAGGIGVPPNVTANAAANASDSQTFATNGPERSGLIQFDVNLLYAHEDSAGVATALLNGVRSYSFIGGGGVDGPVPPVNCESESCEYTGTLPFELGAPFQASVAASAGASGQCSGGCPGGGSSLTFSLFEANGTTLVPFVATPEPSAWGLLLFGVGALYMLSARRRKGVRENGCIQDCTLS